MKTGDTMRTALRIWLFTVIINAIMIAFWIGSWGITIPAITVGAVITIPVPLVANHFLKLAVSLSKSFASRFANSFFFLMFVAALYWFIFIAFVEGPTNVFNTMTREPESRLLIGSNFLSILLACFCSVRQIKRLDDVTSEETVIS